MTSSLPVAERGQLVTGLKKLGYVDIATDYSFGWAGASRPAQIASVAAFWQPQRDQLSSAVVVGWDLRESRRESFLEVAAADLWAPYAVLAYPDRAELWETIPDDATTGPRRVGTRERLGDLSEPLVNWAAQIGRDRVAVKKAAWHQAALWEASSATGAFFDWAYVPTRERLTRLIRSIIKGAGESDARMSDTVELRWLTRAIASRVLWDKRWVDPGDRTSQSDLLLAAATYPVPIPIPTDSAQRARLIDLMSLVAASLSTVDLSAADGSLLGQVLQQGGLTRATQQDLRIFPTPPDLAWRIVDALPMRGETTGRPFIWDGTCGTGTFLAAWLARLSKSLPAGSDELKSAAVAGIRGNDLEPLHTDIARASLDFTLGAPVGAAWDLSTGDVVEAASRLTEPPFAIAGNPPFGANGKTPDMAIGVVDAYLSLLPEGGSFGLVLPRSLLTNTSASRLRSRLRTQTDISEIWEVPSGAFQTTTAETAVVIGRKVSAPKGRRPTTWRSLAVDRLVEDISVAFLEVEDDRFEPPLFLDLQGLFAPCRTLSGVVGEEAVVQGITLRHDPDVGRVGRAGDGPTFLSGRTGVVPFVFDRRHARRLSSQQEFHRARRRSWGLFDVEKVLVSRHAPRSGGNAWRVVAAVDREGFYPSDQFIAIAPAPGLPADAIVGLLNSSLINAWLQLTNPAYSLRVDTLRRLPIPDLAALAKVTTISVNLARLRRLSIDGAPRNSEIREETARLDTAVFDAYAVSPGLRAAVEGRFLRLGGNRPGFEDVGIAMGAIPSRTVPDLARLDELARNQRDGSLSAAELSELDKLLHELQSNVLVLCVISSLTWCGMMAACSQQRSPSPTMTA